jgi:single-strand DNA-binding protein
MNNATFVGRLGRDAVLKTTPNGNVVASFSVAVDDRVGKEKITLWVDCSMWGDRAQKLVGYLTTGTMVGVNGQVSVRAYADKLGEPKAVMALRVDNVSLLGSNQQSAPQQPQTQPQAAWAGKPKQQQPESQPFVDDDIPF